MTQELSEAYLRFIVSRDRIYQERFTDDNSFFTSGTRPHGLNGKGGYLICFRHDNDLCRRIEETTRQIVRDIPAIIYSSDIIHTTISDYQFKSEFKPDEQITSLLLESIKEAIPSLIRTTIKYMGWLANQSAVIIQGNPDIRFIENAKKIIAAAKKRGIALRLPWGAHITAARFTKEGFVDESRKLLERCKNETPPGLSSISSLDLALLYLQDNKVNYEVLQRFNL
jgi:hypothetical protein